MITHVSLPLIIRNTLDRQKSRSTHILPLDIYIEGVLAGDRGILSRAITLVESTQPQDQELAAQLLDAVQPHTGNSFRLGITGIPGVGKSTFIETFGLALAEKEGKKIAVLSVDPSSSRTGGSIMGDKTRMETLSRHPNVYIRPSPSGLALGGVAPATREVRDLCEAAGYDFVLIETVGVGQSETAVKSMTDFFMLLLLAGAGDELQGMKRGIMEMAEGVLITKADGDNLTKARLARLEYSNALQLFPPSTNQWRTEVLITSAVTRLGIEDTIEMLKRYEQHLKSKSLWQEVRAKQNIEALHERIEIQLLLRLYNNPNHLKAITYAEQSVRNGTSPASAAYHALQTIYP